MRAFFAVAVPAGTGEGLMRLLPPLPSLRRAGGGRADRLHLTLHFLGEAPAGLAGEMGEMVLPSAFRLSPGRLVLLPEAGPVRILAASVGGDVSALRAVHGAIGGELARLGVKTEKRAYLPHITLARSEPALPQQVRSQTPMTPREDLSFEVREVQLIESRAVGTGFEYGVLRTWGLG